MADLTDVQNIASRVKGLRELHRRRDARAAEVGAVRHGNFESVAPHLFSEDWPRSVVANRIDVIARHAAAALAPLPIVSCSSVTAMSDSARRFADRRSQIVNHYFKRSNVQTQMQSGADQFYTYGILVTSVEPDLDENFPNIIVEDSIGVYPVWDRKGRTSEVARVFRRSTQELKAEYPELAPLINERLKLAWTGERAVEVVKYDSKDRLVMYLADAPDVVFYNIKNRLGRCTTVVTQRPGLDRDIQGAFDDLIFVQLAHHAMQVYVLSAAAQSVNAPIAAPNDVHEIAFGPGEVVRSSEPEKIRRVGLDVPPGAWMAAQSLAEDLQFGAITPEALGGSIDASVVTGKGVQQLMAGYSQQIAMSQESLVGHWTQVAEIAFAMDETFWPNQKKSIAGHAQGTPYSLDYTPAKDIKGDHTVEVQYGGVAGLDPNRALVFMLQSEGAGLVSKDYVRRHLPSDINPDEEESKILTEQLRGSLVQGVSALVQALPQYVANGQDPSDIIMKTAQAVQRAQKGEEIEKILSDLFPPPPPPETQGQVDPMTGQPVEGGGDGLTPSGMPPGLRQGIATEGPGGRPPLEMLFAGMTSGGQPNLQAGVSRMNPARTV